MFTFSSVYFADLKWYENVCVCVCVCVCVMNLKYALRCHIHIIISSFRTMTVLYTSTPTLKPFEDSKPTGMKVDTAEITTLPILPKYRNSEKFRMLSQLLVFLRFCQLYPLARTHFRKFENFKPTCCFSTILSVSYVRQPVHTFENLRILSQLVFLRFCQ